MVKCHKYGDLSIEQPYYQTTNPSPSILPRYQFVVKCQKYGDLTSEQTYYQTTNPTPYVLPCVWLNVTKIDLTFYILPSFTTFTSVWLNVTDMGI